MRSEPDLADKVTALHQALSSSGVPHAFGGALALAYYAEPRATIDIDINLFVPPEQHDTVRAALAPLGIDAAIPRVEREGQGRVMWGRTPIDLFYAYLPFHDAMLAEIREVPFGGGSIPILSLEHLVVCKAAFNRPKDWLDIADMVAGNPGMQWDEVDRWTEAIIGAEDPRTGRLRSLRPG